MRFAARFTKWILFAAWLGTAHCSFALDNVTLRLNWTHGFQFAGYYAAKELGYYEKAGLNVSLEESAPNSDPAPNVISGRAQYGIGSSSLLLARAANKPVVVLASIFQHSPYVIYTAQNIEHLGDLAGKKILLEAQSEELLAYLEKEGIAANQIQILSQNIDPHDLITGKADAISGRLGNQPYSFDLAHFAYQTFTPRMARIDFYGDNLFTSENELRDHPEHVRAFMQASLHGWRYALAHPNEIIELILTKYSTHYSREYLRFEAEQMTPLLQADIVDIGYTSPARWQRIANIYTDAGLLPKSFLLNGFIYTPHSGNADTPNTPGLPSDHAGQFRGWILALLLFLAAGLLAFYIRHIHLGLKQKKEELCLLNQREITTNHVLKLLTSSASLTDILNGIIASVQLHDSTALSTIVLMSADGTQLRIGTVQARNNSSKNEIDLGCMCCCPKTISIGKRSIVENIQNDPACSECKEIASQAGLRSCFAEPIVASTGKTVGILTIYHREQYEPSKDDIKLISHLAHLASVAVEHLESKQMLQQQHELISKVSAEVPGIIFQFRRTPDGRFSFPFISNAVRKMYGLKPEDLREDATPFFAFRHPEDAARLEESVQESARSLTRWHIEYRLILPGQGIRWRLGDAMPEKLEDGSIVWYGFITDITERKLREERIRHMAQYDALTDLPNRALLSDRLQQALATAKREHKHVAIMFTDFDNFKPINDSLGHAIGDKLLQKSAERMQGCLRESDTIARIGGDEFVILLPNTESENDARIVAEKIRQSIDIPFEIEDNTLKTTVSIGIAIYPEHGENEIQLSKNADCAMYHAKQAGRNTVVTYHHQMQVIGQ